MGNQRIIVIEDDPDIAWLIQVRLEDAGYRVHIASDGASGLASFIATGADLVLLDVNLPVMDGREVYARMRERSRVPVVLMTAYGWDAGQIDGIGLDPSCFLPKPFSTRDLLARVRGCLEGSDTLKPAAEQSVFLT